MQDLERGVRLALPLNPTASLPPLPFLVRYLILSQLPHLADSFRRARAQCGIPPSPLFPPTTTNFSSSAVPASAQSQLGLLRTQSAYHPSSSANPGMRRASTATMRNSVATQAPIPATVRPSDGDAAEPPPPPYSRQDPEPEATAQLTRQLSRLSTGGVPVSGTSGASGSGGAIPASGSGARSGETPEARAERERRELEEAIRLSRESAEEEEALRLSRESAEAEEMARLERERDTERREREQEQERVLEEQRVSGNSGILNAQPPPLPARSIPSLMDDQPSASLAAPLQPIRTGSNNPFASALDPSSSSDQAPQPRYAPPPGPPPGHPGLGTPSFASSTSYTPPSGPPPSGTRNPFADPSSAQTSTAPLDLAVLAKYDTVILVDDSGSMAGDRWRQVRVVRRPKPLNPTHS